MITEKQDGPLTCPACDETDEVLFHVFADGEELWLCLGCLIEEGMNRREGSIQIIHIKEWEYDLSDLDAEG